MDFYGMFLECKVFLAEANDASITEAFEKISALCISSKIGGDVLLFCAQKMREFEDFE